MENLSNVLDPHFFRHSYGKLVSILVRYFGLAQVEIAEDIVQDALVVAMDDWSVKGVPENPEAWLMEVSKKKAINYLRRNQTLQTKVLPAIALAEQDALEEKDSMLRMIFSCCHPDLSADAQMALALKTLCGLSIPEISSALLLKEDTVNKKLYRAKKLFREGNISLELPGATELEKRVEVVNRTLYLLFSEGYYSTHPKKTVRVELCFEAIRLQRQFLEAYPNAVSVRGLLSLMLLNVARIEGRVDHEGALLLLQEQDRSGWDRHLIAEGMEHLSKAMQVGEVNAYLLQAGIVAEHCLAPDFSSTNWKSILQQYDLLLLLEANPVIELNKCIAQFYSGDKTLAMERMGVLREWRVFKGHVHFLSALGVMHQEVKDPEKAVLYFREALAQSNRPEERKLLQGRILRLSKYGFS